MAILARFLALALLATLSSALDQWGLFGCPDFKKGTTAIPYSNKTAMDNYVASLVSRYPLTVIAAGESEEAEQYSCITLASGGTVSYYKGGVQATKPLPYNNTIYQFAGKLPQGLMGVPDNTTARTWTIVGDSDGIIVLKTCKGALLSHFTSTYVLVDNSINATALDMKCLIPALDKSYSIRSKQKGVCDTRGSTGGSSLIVTAV